MLIFKANRPTSAVGVLEMFLRTKSLRQMSSFRHPLSAVVSIEPKIN